MVRNSADAEAISFESNRAASKGIYLFDGGEKKTVQKTMKVLK